MRTYTPACAACAWVPAEARRGHQIGIGITGVASHLICVRGTNPPQDQETLLSIPISPFLSDVFLIKFCMTVSPLAYSSISPLLHL